MGKKERCVLWLVVGKDGDVRKRKKKRKEKKEKPHDLARRATTFIRCSLFGHEQGKHLDVPFLVDVCTHALLVKQTDTCSRKENIQTHELCIYLFFLVVIWLLGHCTIAFFSFLFSSLLIYPRHS